MRLPTRRLLVVAALCAAPATLAAQDYTCDKPGDVEVRRLTFVGNSTFSDALLRNSIITEPSSWWRWLRFFGAKRCLDKAEFPRDSVRLLVFYQKSGYYDARVRHTERALSKTAVAIEFSITEGPPTVVTALDITGLDSVAERSSILAKLPLRKGDAFDLDSLSATEFALRRRLRDDGYPAADVLRTLDSTDKVARHAVVHLTVEPGTRAHLGAIELFVTPRDSGKKQEIPNSAVRHILGLNAGDLYRETKVERGKRNLILTQAYGTVTVDVDSNEVRPPGDSIVSIHVSLTESYMKSARAGGGWGTLDCFRTQGEYHDLNFARSAWRLDMSGRLSKIGIGRPLGGAAGFCTAELRRDPYSTRLNYYLGSTFTAPSVLKLGLQPSLTVYGERRSEFQAYVRTTFPGAILSATRISTTRRVQTVSYQLEYGRTEAQPAIFCALQNLCLPADRDPLLKTRLIAVAGWQVSQDWSDDQQYPTRGGVGRLELRHASSAIGSDASAQFSKGTADVSLYFGLGNRFVLTPRLRVGAVVGPSFTGTASAIPQQERLFAGGGQTVRGFDQNDLGPKVYITPSYDTVRADGAVGDNSTIKASDTVYFRVAPGVKAERSVPTGGSALVVTNLELRWLAWRLQLSAFVDAGELWTPGALDAQDRFRNLKFTPGIGFRFATPVGVFGIDLAYNSYAPRPGAAFFDTPIKEGGQLFCVSPGNTLVVTGVNSTQHAPFQAPGSCPRDFQPPTINGFLRRLNVTFGIGQAY